MKSDSSASFVDANVLVYAALKDDPRNEAAKNLLANTAQGVLHISPQILAEFYSTITSSKRVSMPYKPSQAVEFMETLLGYEHVVVLPISQETSLRWISLLKTTEVKGPLVFDFLIVATMLIHGVTKLFTYNAGDFKGFTDIEVLEPPLDKTTV
jgi:predicted nucleic acid-binding protein